MKLKPNCTILFQGDSITDCGRLRTIADQPPMVNDSHCMGNGYAGRIASKLLSMHPALNLSFYNCGISGNRITQMADRWEYGFEIMEPDVVSILIGVNDTWHGVAKGTPENGVDLDTYEEVYRKLLDRLKQRFPATSLVICEPFTLECGAVKQMNFHPDIDLRRERAKSIADTYADVWVPFQQLFDACVEEAPAAYWAHDGVHPSMAGHERMAGFWLDCVAKA